jgi:hypothetical protein
MPLTFSLGGGDGPAEPANVELNADLINVKQKAGEASGEIVAAAENEEENAAAHGECQMQWGQATKHPFLMSQ